MEYLLLAVPAGIYLGMPLLIKFSQNIDPSPQIDPVEPSQWPASVAQTMSRVEHDLYALGFTITGRYQMASAMPNTGTMLTMLVNYKSGDKAMITAIWGQTDSVWTLGTLYTEFSTRFEDGHSFDTMNSAVLGAFKRGPKDIKTQVPSVKDAADLWALHRYVMRKHGAKGYKLAYDAKDTLAYFRRIWRESFEEQVGFGRYVFNGKHFQPSFLGAYIMTWGLMWPMVWIRTAQMNARAAALVREWKQSSESPLAESPFDDSRISVVRETQGSF